MHPNLVNYALNYASHGFSVIPIGTDKRPLIKFADKPPLTGDEIKRIWQKYPTANIALKTDKFFVIDVDRHEGDGMESIKALNHDEWFKDTLTERTAHNGFHFFFTKPKNVAIQQNIGFLPNVDLKAHENNYVVVAPSVLGDKSYQWLNSEPMKEPPKELLELILEKQKETIPVDDDLKGAYIAKDKTATAQLFEKIVDGLGETGGRNNALASFMGGLLFRGVDPNKAYQLAIIANSNTKDKLSDDEVYKTCESMLDKELRRRNIDD